MKDKRCDEMTVRYVHEQAEDTWGSEVHRYGRDCPHTLGSHVESIAIEKDYQGNCTLYVNMLSKRVDDKQKLTDQATALLDHAGLENIKAKGLFDNQAACSVSVDLGRHEPEVINGIIALARDAPDKNGSTRSTPAMIDVAACSQIIDMELARQKIAPSLAGLQRFDVSNMPDYQVKGYGLTSPLCYVDVDLSGYALSPVTYIRESSQTEKDVTGNVVHQKTAIIEVSQGNLASVKKALDAADIKFEESPNKQALLCEATSSQVVSALASAKILPVSFAEEAKSTYSKHHPEVSQAAPSLPQVRHNAGSKFSM